MPGPATNQQRGPGVRVVIIGAGEVGYHVVGTLYREGVEIVGVDHDQGVLDHLRQEFGIETLQGNAMDPAILERAGVGACDLFVAITDSDETNIISCLMAAELGAQHKIARVKTLDFVHEASFGESQTRGIDLIINPYEVASEHLANLVQTPQATDFEQFLGGRLVLLRVPIGEGNPLAGESVLEFGQDARIPQTLIALIQRRGQYFMPEAEEVIQAGDQVYFFAERSQLPRLFGYLGLPSRPARRVFINGGGHIGYALARRLERLGCEVRILEISEERCNELSQLLDDTLILHADGTDGRALKSEGIEHADFFISVTAQDQINVVACMLVKEYSQAKTVALVKQPEYIPILIGGGMVDVAFSPRLLTARKILRFVRGRNLDSFFAFPNSDIELLELEIKHGMPCESGPISTLGFPKGVLIGAVQRDGHIFVPRGEDRLVGGDTIMLLQQRRNRRFSRAFFLEAGAESPVENAAQTPSVTGG